MRVHAQRAAATRRLHPPEACAAAAAARFVAAVRAPVALRRSSRTVRRRAIRACAGARSLPATRRSRACGRRTVWRAKPPALAVYVHVYLHLSIDLSICLPIYISIYLSVYISIYLYPSIHPSTYPFLYGGRADRPLSLLRLGGLARGDDVLPLRQRGDLLKARRPFRSARFAASVAGLAPRRCCRFFSFL